MPARTTRQQARERLIKTSMASLDKVIPPDEAVPLKGSLFRDREDQAAEMRRALIPTVLEERAALEGNARVEEVSFKGYTILVGRGPAGERVEDTGSELRVFYCWKLVRSLSRPRTRQR